MMKNLFLTIDKLLRGGFTNREDLQQGRVDIRVGLLLFCGLFLGAMYGVFMGLYGVMRPVTSTYEQLLATTVKVPLLFMLTLIVTFPSLYVFSTLSGSRLRFVETLRLLLIGIAVNLALLASFGPVTGFFTLCTESYAFMVVLNVILYAVAGLAGLIFMYRALCAVVEEPLPRVEAPRLPKGPDSDEESKPPMVRPPYPRTERAGKAKVIFNSWAIIYCAVGAQMGWILRPFIGSPDLPFELFRERESNFFEAFVKALAELLR